MHYHLKVSPGFDFKQLRYTQLKISLKAIYLIFKKDLSMNLRQ